MFEIIIANFSASIDFVKSLFEGLLDLFNFIKTVEPEDLAE